MDERMTEELNKIREILLTKDDIYERTKNLVPGSIVKVPREVCGTEIFGKVSYATKDLIVVRYRGVVSGTYLTRSFQRIDAMKFDVIKYGEGVRSTKRSPDRDIEADFINVIGGIKA